MQSTRHGSPTELSDTAAAAAAPPFAVAGRAAHHGGLHSSPSAPVQMAGRTREPSGMRATRENRKMAASSDLQTACHLAGLVSWAVTQ